MKNVLFIFGCMFLSLAGFAQTVKPIPQMVINGHAGQNVFSTTLFSDDVSDISANKTLLEGLRSGTILQWDAAKVAHLRSLAQVPVTLVIPSATGQSWTLDLVPAKNFSPEFAVHDAATGREQQVDHGTHFWGIVRGDNNSLVSISIFDTEIIGAINNDEGNWVIGAIEGDTRKAHILYNDHDLKANSNFECLTDDELHKIGDKHVGSQAEAGPENCVRMFVETDYTLFQNKGSVANVTTYMTGVFSQVSALYTNDAVNVVLHDLFVWSTTDPYTGPSSSNYLTQFRTAKNGVFNGDLAHLVGIHNLGGVAYLDVLCNPAYGVGYSSINATYSNVPTYSWTIEVLTHEIGHNLGSPHTHACTWSGNLPIDGCGPTAGYSEGCTTSLPTNGGTIMSYCHLVSGVGINFNNGFGPQPGDRIRNEVYNAACLAACGGGGGGGVCTYSVINSNTFESGFGIWTDGGTDCIRTSNSTYANSPSFSIQLRDNTNTSVTSTTSQNWAAYDKIQVEFTSYSVGFANGEDFWLQISTNGGSTYTTKATFVAGTDFTNGNRIFKTVEILGPFTSTTRLRFRADASTDSDQVYIDDVIISACTEQFQGGAIEERTEFTAVTATDEMPAIYEFQANPNPAAEWLNIGFISEAELPVNLFFTDLTGKVVLQQSVTATRGQNNLQIATGQLNNGFYLLHLTGGDNQITHKVMIAK